MSSTNDGGDDTDSKSHFWIYRRREIGRRVAKEFMREKMEEEEEEEGESNDNYHDHENAVPDVDDDGPSPPEAIFGSYDASRKAASE